MPAEVTRRVRPMSPPVDDDFAAVLAAARDKQEWALAVLYRRLQPAVLRYLRGRCHDDAEDVASDVWIDVARALASFEGDEAAFRRLVFSIAWRRQADRARRATRRPAEAIAERDWAGGDDPAESALAALGADEAVRRVVELLTPEQAEVVLLRVVADLSVGAVAAIVGKRPGAVRAIQHRALLTLGRKMTERP